MNKIDIAILDELRKATRQEQLAYLLAEHNRLMEATNKLLALDDAKFEAFAEAELNELRDGMQEQERMEL